MIYYEHRNPEKNSSKFYKIWFDEKVQNGTRIWQLWTIRGKIGTNGTKMLEEFTNEQSLFKRILHLHNLRINHGYKSKEDNNPQLEMIFY